MVKPKQPIKVGRSASARKSASLAAKSGAGSARTVVKECPDSISEIASQLGGRAGTYAGSLLGGGISRLFGKGDYKVEYNSLMSAYGTPAGPAPPHMFRGPNHGTRVVEREFLGTVTGSTTFANTSYRLNPADSTTFPWLSGIAAQFEQWEPNGLVFEYRTTSSEFNGSTQALGAVILATDYDPTDPAYTTRGAMANSDYSVTVKSSDSAVHGVECAPEVRPTRLLYTAAAAPTTPGRLSMTDLGNFQIATDGLASAAVIGELWVSYDITFYKKSASEPSGELSLGAFAYSTGTPSAANPLAPTFGVSEHIGDGYGYSITQGSGCSVGFTVPPTAVGRYLQLSFVSGANTAATTGFTATPTGCTESTNVKRKDDAYEFAWEGWYVITAPTGSVALTFTTLNFVGSGPQLSISVV